MSENFPTTVRLMGFHISPDGLALFDALNGNLPVSPRSIVEELLVDARKQWRTESEQCLGHEAVVLAHKQAIRSAEEPVRNLGIRLLEAAVNECAAEIVRRVRRACVLDFEERTAQLWQEYCRLVTSEDGLAKDWHLLNSLERHAGDPIGPDQGRGEVECYMVRDVLRRDQSFDYRSVPRLVGMLEGHVLNNLRIPQWINGDGTEPDPFGMHAHLREVAIGRLICEYGYCRSCAQESIALAASHDGRHHEEYASDDRD